MLGSVWCKLVNDVLLCVDIVMLCDVFERLYRVRLTCMGAVCVFVVMRCYSFK